MENHQLYRQTLSFHLSEIQRLGHPVVIFGAGRAGWYIMQVLEQNRIPIAAFCDNDPAKQKHYHGYRVLSAQDLKQTYPDAYIFLGVFVPDTATAIQKQFRVDMQYTHVFFDMAAFLFAYFTTVARRPCNETILAESIGILFENYREGAIHYGYTKGGFFVSPFVTSVITQKCSLRCRDCAQFIPYYTKPLHISVESVIADLRQYAKAFDVVPEISLHGGEPFLHPNLKEICHEAAKIPNIVFISFVTNGTIMLPEDVLQELSKCGADVNQSGGYGTLSKKQGELCKAFPKYNIYSDVMFCSPSEMWTQIPQPKPHNRPGAENDAIFQRCVSTKTCCQIMHGELHRCSLSMHGSHQGLIPRHEDDIIHLQDPAISEKQLIANIRGFLTRERALHVCDYCDMEGGTPVPPAIQLSKKNNP